MRRAHNSGWFCVWGLPTALLAVALFGSGLRAEDGEANLPENGTKATIVDVSGDRTVTVNEDGSKTVNTTVTTTNAATGTLRTGLSETTVQKTDAGRAWTRDTAISGSNGFSQNSSATGSSSNNGDGTGWWNSLTQGTVTGPKGKSVDYTTERSSAWSVNDQGGRDFNSTATTTTSNGGTTTINRELSTYQVSDGVKGFTGESNRTFGNGATVDRTVNGTVTKTDTGRTWDTTVNGTATGPNGNTRSWTTNLDGSVSKNEDGSISIDSSKSITGEKGGTLTVEKEGTLTKGADGQWHYEGSKDVSHTPPTASPAAACSVSADRSVTQNADGSKTIDTTATTTNQNTGATRALNNSTTVQKTETGSAWTRNTEASGSHGAALNSTTTGASTNNGDGSGSWNSNTNGTITGPKGNSNDYTTDRAGTWKANDQGGRDFNSTATTSTSNGGTSTVNRNLSTSRNSDTEKGFTGSSNRTFGNGSSVDRSANGSVTTTETGKSWNATVDGTATGPKGNSTSWTNNANGSVTDNGDGTYSLNANKSITGEKGGQAEVNKEGTLSKGESGKWHYESTKDGGYTPPAAPATASKSTAPAQTAGSTGAWSRWKEQAAQPSAEGASAAKRAQWREKTPANEPGGNSWRDRVGEGQGARERDLGASRREGALGGARGGRGGLRR